MARTTSILFETEPIIIASFVDIKPLVGDVVVAAAGGKVPMPPCGDRGEKSIRFTWCFHSSCRSIISCSKYLTCDFATSWDTANICLRSLYESRRSFDRGPELTLIQSPWFIYFQKSRFLIFAASVVKADTNKYLRELST